MGGPAATGGKPYRRQFAACVRTGADGTRISHGAASWASHPVDAHSPTWDHFPRRARGGSGLLNEMVATRSFSLAVLSIIVVAMGACGDAPQSNEPISMAPGGSTGAGKWLDVDSPPNHATATSPPAPAITPIIAKGAQFHCTPTQVWDGDGPIWCYEGPRTLPSVGDLSCAMVKSGDALRWDRYWHEHRC